MNRRNMLLCAALAACCAAAYAPALAHDFVNYDDGLYVTANARVQAGLSWPGVVWAFTTERAMYMHPLTWMSHMLDCDLYGLRPWGHHLTSVLFHAANAALLFLVLAGMTKKTWPALLAAALWAAHPLRVESVAWVAERKDVLSMFFWLLGMGAYAWHRERPGFGRYMTVVALFILGFLSKPMMVTFPFVLLLLDWWPLRRIDGTGPAPAARTMARPVLEKVPLFVLTAAMCAVTMAMQSRGNNLDFMNSIPLADRCANAVVVYALYLAKTVWPSGLAVYYPHPIHRPLWQVAAAAALLLVITAVTLAQSRRRPWLAVGWFWYLGTLVPVIELVQAGTFSHADRYTYIPLVGICVMAAWTWDDLLAAHAPRRRAAAAAALLCVAGYTAATVHQIGFWKDSKNLFGHALAVTEDNPLARNNLGAALLDEGDNAAAREQFGRALELDPAYTRSELNIALLLEGEGERADAMRQCRAVIEEKPDNFTARMQLGRGLMNEGDPGAAEAEFNEALRIDPESMRAHAELGELWNRRGDANKALDVFQQGLQINPRSREINGALAAMLFGRGKLAEAAVYYQEVLDVDPYDAQTLYNLGAVLAALQRPAEAEERYRQALRIKPRTAEAHNNLAGLLAQRGSLDEARRHYEEAIRLRPDFADALNNLAGVLAAQGNLNEARARMEKALEINPAHLNARLNLANLLIQTGRPGEAIAHLKMVLERDPENQPARQMMLETGAAPAPPPQPQAPQ